MLVSLSQKKEKRKLENLRKELINERMKYNCANRGILKIE